MQFLVIGKDGTDKDAMKRRLAVRRQHIDLGEKLRQSGNMWYGVALWNEKNEMCGSALLMDSPSEKEFNEWLEVEPYVTGKVWKTIEVLKCNVRDPWQFNRPKSFFEKRDK